MRTLTAPARQVEPVLPRQTRVRFGIVAMCSPRDHPRISAAEIDYLQKGGALVDMDRPKKDAHITESELELDNVEQADVEPAVVKSADVLPNSADETPK